MIALLAMLLTLEEKLANKSRVLERTPAYETGGVPPD
jgi:hypothetical protein